ncbi:MAG: hypothetical protein Kow0077_32380 [Anaerolineae bacterium]
MSERILIVEDEAIPALDLKHTLHAMGYEVVSWVTTGEQSITDSERQPPDLILMDIRLAGAMDGIEAARQLRLSHPGVPIVYITANNDPETIRRATDTAPAGFISKPFTQSMLREVMLKALRQ